MPEAPPTAPKPGFVHAAVTFFTHTIEVGVEEARLLIRQGLATDIKALEAAIAKAEGEQEAAPPVPAAGPPATIQAAIPPTPPAKETA
jgi:hypothetical protein